MIHHIQKLSLTLTKVAIVLILLSSIVVAQESGKIIDLDNKAIANLKTAIKSDNPGLRKSGIYFSGKYSVTEVSETLVEQLEIEENPDLRVLLVRVLYIIDDQKFMDQIYQVALNDSDLRVKRIAGSIYSAININYSERFVDTNK